MLCQLIQIIFGSFTFHCGGGDRNQEQNIQWAHVEPELEQRCSSVLDGMIHVFVCVFVCWTPPSNEAAAVRRDVVEMSHLVPLVAASKLSPHLLLSRKV